MNKEQKKGITFAIEPSLLGEVDNLADREMVNRSIIIRKALVAYLRQEGVEL